MPTLTGFTRPPDPIDGSAIAGKVSTDIGKPVTVLVTANEASVTGTTITEADRSNIQASISSYVYTSPVTSVSKGRTPTGKTQDSPIGGVSYKSSDVLAANASVSSGWINTSGYGSLLYVVRADQPSAVGGIVVEYSDDAVTPLPGGAAISYTADQINMQIQRALVPKGTYTRITYTNGATAQTSFRFEVKLSATLIQPTQGSLNLPMTDSALAMYVASDMQLTDGTSYGRITRTGASQNVNVTNFPAAQATTLQGSSTATVTTVTTTATVLTVLNTNPNRKGAKFFSVTGTIFLKYGTGATTTNFTERLVTNGTHELSGPEIYKGAISAIGAGTLNITEW